MRLTHLTFRHVLLLFLLASVYSLPAFAAGSDEVPDAVKAVRSALVRIHVVFADYEQGREVKQEASGSGVIISPDGYVVTNHHVVQDAEHIVCTLTDQREFEAKLVGSDPLSDVAVIKLPAGTYPDAKFGDSSALRLGQTIYALGCPMAISQSMTKGIVSNKEMVMPGSSASSSLTLEGENVGSIVLWIGHDAMISPGNSGGPLVDDDGNIVGINELKFGLNGAIPSNLAKGIAAELKENGKVVRSWTGIEGQPLLKSTPSHEGVLVSDAVDGSPAVNAGIKSGDILVSLDGKPVSAKFKEEMPAFNQLMFSLPIGNAVEAKLLRDGKELSVNLTTVERPKVVEKQKELKSWGICSSNISYFEQKEKQLDSQDGVLVQSFLPSGPAGGAKPPLAEDDIIIEVGGKKIKDLMGLRDVTRQLTEGKNNLVPTIVLFQRDRELMATVVKLGKPETTETGSEITKAWLALDSQPLSRELAKALGLGSKPGVRVTRVYAKANAAAAGLKVGDVILKLDGEVIPAEQADDEEVFPSLIRQYDIGSKVKLSVFRNGKVSDVVVALQTAPRPISDYPKYEDETLEFTCRDIAFADRTSGNLVKAPSGVVVSSVASGGWAALANVEVGDVLAQINGKEITDLTTLKTVLDDTKKSKPNFVVFYVHRGIHSMFLEVKPVWPED